MNEHLFTRRAFLGGAVTLVCSVPALAALGCGTSASGDGPPLQTIDGWLVPLGTMMAPLDYARVSALFDTFIPSDEKGPGAVALGAPFYLDQLLGAFRTDPPRLFAGGPFSGRHGGAASFDQFQRLTRVEELRWRTFLEGSRGIPEREWNGPVVGLADRYHDGLLALEQAALTAHGTSFTALAFADRHALVATATDGDFVQTAYVHAVEGSYGDPVYGGNRDAQGWTLIRFEGDRQPIGYSAEQLAHPEKG